MKKYFSFILVWLMFGCGGQSVTEEITEKSNQVIYFEITGTVSKVNGDNSFFNTASGDEGTGQISYKSSDETVATVDTLSGKVDILTVGTTTILATKQQDSNFNEASLSYNLIVIPRSFSATALMSHENTTLQFPEELNGISIMRTTDENCNITDYQNCSSGQLDIIGGDKITDTAFNLNQHAFYTFLLSDIILTKDTRTIDYSYPKSSHETLFFQNKLWTIGGFNAEGLTNEIFNSTDGVHWNKVITSNIFSERQSSQAIVFQDKLWVFGGVGITGMLNDVWSSENGIDWYMESIETTFPIRRDTQIVAFKDKLWMIGGYDSTNREAKNDVWSSENGIDWILITEHTGFSARSHHTAAVYNEKIWVIAGSNAKDVWSSSDGVNWMKNTENNLLARTGHELTVYDSKLWVIGGYIPSRVESGVTIEGGFSNDILWTTDGETWNEIQSQEYFSPRNHFQSVAFDNKLWIIGGNTANGRADDIWSYDSANWRKVVQINISFDD